MTKGVCVPPTTMLLCIELQPDSLRSGCRCWLNSSSSFAMFLCFTLFYMASQCSSVGTSNPTPSCLLTCSKHESTYRKGDFIIGGILQRSLQNKATPMNFTAFCDLWNCLFPSPRYLRHAMAVTYAIEEINRNPELLPNLTLGYQLFDSCGNSMKALQGVLSLMSRQTKPAPNYCCQGNSPLIGIVGDMSSVTSFSMAQLMGLYKYPQISFGAVDAQFSDKSAFPSFYRTAPSELSQFAGISQLLKYFGWTWVGILTTEDDSGERAQRELKKAIEGSGGCVAFSYTLATDVSKLGVRKLSTIINAVRNSTAQVIVLHGSGTSIAIYFLDNGWKGMPHKTWIASVAMSFLSDYAYCSAYNVLNGTLAFSVKKGEIIGFQDFLYNVHPAQFPDDGLLRWIWELRHDFKCTFNGVTFPNGSSLPKCSENETWKSGRSTIYNVFNFRYTYNIYNAVYAFAHALHNMLASSAHTGTGMATGHIKDSLEPWKLNRFLNKIHFKNPSGHEIAFDDSGELPAKFDVLNWILFPNGAMAGLEVGSFDSSAPLHKQLVINPSSILWHSEGGNLTKVPRSLCSESCLPGYRKAPIEGKSVCCFDCVPCSEGEFSNSSDMENCLKCPQDQWPNERKDGCFNRTIAFLSYSDTLGSSLASLSIAFTLTTLVILAIFVQHRDTAIVKANNRDLSYALLISLMLAFLCSLLFIGRPATWTCLIQQAAFGVIFTVAVSCVLAKTSMVVLAFNATKPGSTMSRWLGPRASGSMVLLCTLGEVVICVAWLLTSPAHPHRDMVSEAGKIILQCDQGSATAFYMVLGYMGLLALVSFIAAFLARNLPDRFNEAKLITFSMLVFCSVWVTFIPAYLSTKGRYMVAMEIFAILASSAGLLGCIFIPKCHIVLFKPAINTKVHLVVKSNL